MEKIECNGSAELNQKLEKKHSAISCPVYLLIFLSLCITFLSEGLKYLAEKNNSVQEQQ